MVIFSNLSFAASLAYLLLGVVSLYIDRKSQLNRIFFVLCMNFANWAFCYSFIYYQQNKAICWFWYKLTCFGWCTSIAVLLHFFLVLTEKNYSSIKRKLYFLIYIPTLIFCCRVFTGVLLVKDFLWTEIGNVEVQSSNTVWSKAFIIYFVSYLLIGFYILIAWGRKSQVLREKKQSKIISIFAVFPGVSGLAINIFLPQMGIRFIPAIAQILILLWIMGINYAVVKYRLLNFTPKVASDEIFIKIKDFLIMLDNDMRIIKVNPAFIETFEYKNEELLGKKFENMISFVKPVSDGILKECTNVKMYINTMKGYSIPVNMSSREIKDSAGDDVGILFVGQDIRENLQLENEILERRRIEKGLIETTYSLENLLNNAGQGFLYFDSTLLINETFSLECVRIFDKNIGGMHFSELILENDEERNQNDIILKGIFDEKNKSKREIYLTLLPQEVLINNKYLNIEYKILEEIKDKLYIMIIVTDLTEKKILERKIDEEKKTYNMIVKIITNMDDFIDLVKYYNKFFDEDIIEIFSNNNDIKDIFSEICRTIHTFKGNLGQLGMTNAVEKIHELESELNEIETKTDNISVSELKKTILSKEPLKWVDDEIKVIEKILGKKITENENMLLVQKNRLLEIEDKVLAKLSHDECYEILPLIRQLRYKSLKELLNPYAQNVLEISRKLNKTIYPVEINGDDIFIDPEKYHDFIKSLIHVFNNSIVHGVEMSDQRIQAGKNEFGTIKCEIKTSKDFIKIIISDDGIGIDFQKIKNEAVEKGIIDADNITEIPEKELMKFIFMDDFSTKESVTYLAGRGVGLSAVKTEIEKLKGSVSVKSEFGKGTEFCFTLPNLNLNNTLSICDRFIQSCLLQSKNEVMINNLKLDSLEFTPFKAIEDNTIELSHKTSLINFKGAAWGTFVVGMDERLLIDALKTYKIEYFSAEEKEKYMEGIIAEIANTILGNSLRLFGDIQDNLCIETPTTLSAPGYIKSINGKVWTCRERFLQGNLTIGLILTS